MTRSLPIRLAFAVVVLSTAFLQYREVDRLRRRQDAAGSLKPGVEAPPLNARGLDGFPIDREVFEDRVLLVSFWASWCVPCRAEMPELARFAEDWNRDPNRERDLVYIAVNVAENPEDVRDVTRDPLYRDVLFGLDPEGEIAARWEAAALPTTFVISPEGTVLLVTRGYDPALRIRLHGVLRKYKMHGA